MAIEWLKVEICLTSDYTSMKITRNYTINAIMNKL